MKNPLKAFSLILLFVANTVVAAPRSAAAYHCGGSVESRVWDAWDNGGRGIARDRMIADRLLKQGDSYALYDLEITFHNLLSMTVRCGRQDRLLQFANDWQVVYSKLESIPGPDTLRGILKYSKYALMEQSLVPAAYKGQGWVCRGGSMCSAKNRLIDKEVELFSIQGMGLLSDLAYALSKSSVNRTPRGEKFISQTVEVALDGLSRWSGPGERERWRQYTGIDPSVVTDGASKWFFTDRELWQIAIYANVAGILENRPKLKARLDPQGDQLRIRGEALMDLLAFFKSRLTLSTIYVSGYGLVQTADIDQGFWRLYKDNRYASYTDSAPPFQCLNTKDPDSGRVNISVNGISPVPDLGWDFSHARRLVHVLDALDRSRTAMKFVFGVSDSQLPQANLGKRFAGQLLAYVWNGDLEFPLFANWMSGANGWYRVGYDNGTARCVVGFPPYGLSDSFPTGGYVEWGKYYPVIRRLGGVLYRLGESKHGRDMAFMNSYYPGLGSRSIVTDELMFWPSLVMALK